MKRRRPNPILSRRRHRMSSPAAHAHRVARAPASQPVLPDEILAQAARALAQAADFTFSFLPAPNCWRVCDVRDGRVLLHRWISGAAAAFADLVVCDPLHRRHVQLPPIPDDLVASAVVWDIHVFDSFFDPTTDKEEQQKEEQDLLFRVICAVQCQHNLVAFHFSSATGKWSGVTLDQTTPLKYIVVNARCLRYYGLGCFYWTFPDVESLFILDMHQMKFSVVDLPTSNSWHPMGRAIVELGGGRLGLFVADDGFPKRPHILDLYSKTLGNSGVGTEEWHHDKMIPLPDMECIWSILGAVEGYLLLQAMLFQESHYFTLDLKTLLVERLCVSINWIKRARLYASFPPPLSLPSI